MSSQQLQKMTERGLDEWRRRHLIGPSDLYCFSITSLVAASLSDGCPPHRHRNLKLWERVCVCSVHTDCIIRRQRNAHRELNNELWLVKSTLSALSADCLIKRLLSMCGGQRRCQLTCLTLLMLTLASHSCLYIKLCWNESRYYSKIIPNIY